MSVDQMLFADAKITEPYALAQKVSKAIQRHNKAVLEPQVHAVLLVLAQINMSARMVYANINVERTVIVLKERDVRMDYALKYATETATAWLVNCA